MTLDVIQSPYKTADLGWCIAKTSADSLTIVSPSNESESVFTPAQSVMIYQTKHLIALRDLLNWAIEQAQEREP